jgi:hypothetical protein
MRRIGAIVIDGESFDFSQIANYFGHVSRTVLYYAGMRAARTLYSRSLKYILNAKGGFSTTDAPMSEKGKRMVSFSVAKNNSVIVRSFPMNVYRTEKGKGSRSMKRTAGKKIFRSFEGSFDAEDAVATEFRKIIQFITTDRAVWNEYWNTRLKSPRGMTGMEGVL